MKNRKSWIFYIVTCLLSMIEPAESSRPALKTARLNANQTRLVTTTTTTSSPSKTVATQRTPNGGKTSKLDCQCRPEEFTCSSSSSLSSGGSSPTNNSRRKGQLSFTVKVLSLFFPPSTILLFSLFCLVLFDDLAYLTFRLSLFSCFVRVCLCVESEMEA